MPPSPQLGGSEHAQNNTVIGLTEDGPDLPDNLPQVGSPGTT
jgi:hypothetical protein